MKGIVLSGKTTEISETKTYLLLENRVCYYDAPNANDVCLPGETAKKYAESLVDMPVVAKYMVNPDGQPSFGGHEAYVDADGDIQFDTIPIGVHTGVEIRNDYVQVGSTTKELPCLFATQKIWKRNKNVVAAVRRLYEEGELYNSWELEYEKYNYADGVKTITEYTFTGNCFLGVDNDSYPAYGPSAKVISLSSLADGGSALLVAEAAAKDIAEQNKDEEEGGETMKKNKIFESSEEDVETVETVTEEETSEANTEEEHEDQAEETSEHTEETHEDAEEDAAENEEHEESTAADNSEADTQETDSQETSEEEQSEEHELSMDQLIAENASLTEQLEQARAEIQELQRYREIVERQIYVEQVTELTTYVRESEMFTEEEIVGEEIQNLISSLDKAALAQMISDRLIAKKTAGKTATVSKAKKAAEKKISMSSILRESMSSHTEDEKNSVKKCRDIMHDFLTK